MVTPHSSPFGGTYETSRFQTGRESGVSLLEGLIATAVLMFGLLAILPMFHRSTQNNTRGGAASVATQLNRSTVEELLAIPVDGEVLDMAAPMLGNEVLPDDSGTGEKMDLPDLKWDPEAAAAPLPAGDPLSLLFRVGSGDWIPAADAANGDVVYERYVTIRQFTYADISDGVIDVNNPGVLTTLGNAKLFDRPLPSAAPQAQVHFKEKDINIVNTQMVDDEREILRSFRMRLLRTY